MIKLYFKNNFWGYFNFYYRLAGKGLLFYLILSVLISAIDGIGLAMFIPLLQFVGSNKKEASSEESLGSLRYLIDFIESFGMGLTVTSILLVLIGMFVFKGLLKFIQLTYYAKLRQSVLKKIRFELIQNLQALSYTGFLKMDAGKIQNTFTAEVNRLFLSMTSYFNAAQYFFMLSTYIVLAFIANYKFALCVAVGSVLSNFIYRNLYKRTKSASIEISKKAIETNSFLIQTVHYFKYLKSTNTFSKYVGKLKNVIDGYEKINRKMGNMKAIALSVKEPVIIIIVSLVIILQTELLDIGFDTILWSLLLFYRSLSLLGQVQNDWQAFIENIGGMFAVRKSCEEMVEAREISGSVPFEPMKNQLQLKNVDLYYGKVQALKKINISVPVKHTIALVGESGSGKTTIANVIAGLFVPSKGEVLVDDTPLMQINLDSYRNRIGYISQESVIFNDNIYNNITFWAEPTEENVNRFNKIIEIASLKEFINSQPDKELTRLGDNGLLISGGQKQRISIARELYKDCDILILDEATSALDSETEKIIQENIEKLHGRYTVILIAHRLSTIKNADIIYLIDEGKNSASGSFEEMINISPRFRKMVSLQGV